jgi:hypothetical protein
MGWGMRLCLTNMNNSAHNFDVIIIGGGPAVSVLTCGGVK